MKKVGVAALIVLFGGVVTAVLVAVLAFGTKMSGLSASAVGSDTTLWSVWPCPLYFLLVAGAPFIKSQKKRRALLAVSVGVLFLAAWATMDLEDSLVLTGIVVTPSLVVWIPLLGWLQYNGDPKNSRFTP